jgi:hypothetical protein
VFIDFGHCLQWPRHTHAIRIQLGPLLIFEYNSDDMTTSNYISHISGIMDAVHAHLNFKLKVIIIALSLVINNVSHHQVIPVEMYSLCC